MDVSQLEAAITPRTKMIIGVSILGNPAALNIMRSFADAHGLIFFEDNCESMDAELNGQKTGTFGDLGTFSSFFSHHISTIEGGYIVTDDPELDALARSIRAHGWTRDVPAGASLFEASGDFFLKPIDLFYRATMFVHKKSMRPSVSSNLRSSLSLLKPDEKT
jgi:CDP-6-deoxy-D-xylo-4-hexulose-3-dehydrase